jgi:hypothetical protein
MVTDFSVKYFLRQQIMQVLSFRFFSQHATMKSFNILLFIFNRFLFSILIEASSNQATIRPQIRGLRRQNGQYYSNKPSDPSIVTKKTGFVTVSNLPMDGLVESIEVQFFPHEEKTVFVNLYEKKSEDEYYWNGIDANKNENTLNLLVTYGVDGHNIIGYVESHNHLLSSSKVNLMLMMTSSCFTL